MKNTSVRSLLVAVILLAVAVIAEAQQPAKVRRIVRLGLVAPTNTLRTDAFRQGLRELGYVEGKNIVIEWRQVDWKRNQVPALAAELVRLKVEVIGLVRGIRA